MKIELENGDVIFANKSGVSLVTLREQYFYDKNEKITDYIVDVIGRNGMMFTIYSSKSRNLAIEALEKLGKLIEDTDKKTYLDGFKEGTEYALKLMETK